MTDAELLATIKEMARQCSHADQACQLVFFINNTVDAKHAYWRSWRCETHNYGGSGAISVCPMCPQEY